jgi:hypothetical protein
MTARAADESYLPILAGLRPMSPIRLLCFKKGVQVADHVATVVVWRPVTGGGIQQVAIPAGTWKSTPFGASYPATSYPAGEEYSWVPRLVNGLRLDPACLFPPEILYGLFYEAKKRTGKPHLVGDMLGSALVLLCDPRPYQTYDPEVGSLADYLFVAGKRAMFRTLDLDGLQISVPRKWLRAARKAIREMDVKVEATPLDEIVDRYPEQDRDKLRAAIRAVQCDGEGKAGLKASRIAGKIEGGFAPAGSDEVEAWFEQADDAYRVSLPSDLIQIAFSLLDPYDAKVLTLRWGLVGHEAHTERQLAVALDVSKTTAHNHSLKAQLAFENVLSSWLDGPPHWWR